MRNLIVSNTFNDFADATLGMDYSVEDLVSYCEEQSNVLYWINIESVWGPLGFEWVAYDDYGVFNSVPNQFSVLPNVPDPHRLKSFYKLFKNFPNRDMVIPKINFTNIDTICNWGPNRSTIYSPGKRTVELYLWDNSNITTLGNYNIDPETLYLHGSLQNVSKIYAVPRFCVSDENAYNIKLPFFLGSEQPCRQIV